MRGVGRWDLYHATFPSSPQSSLSLYLALFLLPIIYLYHFQACALTIHFAMMLLIVIYKSLLPPPPPPWGASSKGDYYIT